MGVLIGTITGVMIFVGAWLASFGAAALVTMHFDRKKAMRDLFEMMDFEDPKAFEVLKAAIQRDESYAWSWHCNIAMPFQDEGGSHEQGNRAAARAMSTIFGVDVTTFKEWKAFPWAAIANAKQQGEK